MKMMYCLGAYSDPSMLLCVHGNSLCEAGLGPISSLTLHRYYCHLYCLIAYTGVTSGGSRILKRGGGGGGNNISKVDLRILDSGGGEALES